MIAFCTVLVLCFEAVLTGPVPEFGLPLPIAGSSQVRDSAIQAHTLLRTVTDRLNVTLTSNYARLPTTLAQLATIATFTESIDRAVVAPVLALVRDSSGDVRVSFQPVLEGISSTQSYIQQQLPIDLTRLEASISRYVPDRLSDGFRCVRSGLDRLAGSLETLRGAMLEAVKEAGTASVSAAVLKKHVNLTSVYDVARSVSAVRVCLPSIIETINSTIDRLKTADDFILIVKRMIAEWNPSLK